MKEREIKKIMKDKRKRKERKREERKITQK